MITKKMIKNLIDELQQLFNHEKMFLDKVERTIKFAKKIIK